VAGFIAGTAPVGWDMERHPACTTTLAQCWEKPYNWPNQHFQDKTNENNLISHLHLQVSTRKILQCCNTDDWTTGSEAMLSRNLLWRGHTLSVGTAVAAPY